MDNNTRNSLSRPKRITPRNSDIGQAVGGSTTQNTPWRTLNQLANIPRTPLRRASSAGPPSTHRSNRHTPNARTPAARQGIESAKRAVAVTPHGRAAQRGLDLRRAGLTPGRERRRRSGRQQRETPRDTLRALSRLLGPKSEIIVPTPQGPNIITDKKSKRARQDDWDDGPELERPRLSLLLGENYDDDDDDDSLLLPPQSAGVEEENITIQSVELGRRAYSEQPSSRYSRGSFGSIRMSDVFADLHDLEGVRDRYDSSMMDEQAFGGGDAPFFGDNNELPGENTGVLRMLDLDHDQVYSNSSQPHDIRSHELAGDDTETTFHFNVPARDPSTESAREALESFGEVDEEDGFEDIVAVVDHRELEESSILENQVDIDPDITMEARMGTNEKQKKKQKKRAMLSKHGIKYTSLPRGVLKKLAATLAGTGGMSRAKINNEALDAIMQASDWFFEQVSDDLSAYSKHSGRKTIDESDILTLMARQRLTNATTTPFSLAQRYLPRELVQEFRMNPLSRLKQVHQLQQVDEASEEED